MLLKSKTITIYSILIALAIILSYVEARIPAILVIPGIKLGITNIVVLLALYLISQKSAIIINLLRIILVALLFGNVMSLAFSLSGGILSGMTMILLKKTNKFSIFTVSIAGAVSHNIAQIFAAMVILGTSAVAWYMPLLLITGIICGFLIGILGGDLCRRLQKLNFTGKL